MIVVMDKLIRVSSDSLAIAIRHLRDNTEIEDHIPVLLRNGVRASPAQIAKAAHLLHDAAPSKRPGYIDADRQEGDLLVLNIGILTPQIYKINRKGELIDD